MSEAQIQEMLDKKLSESMLAISINSSPVFKDGKSKGTLRIENAPNNRYNMKVRITMDSDEREIYHSDAIKPAQVIKEDYLDEELKKGPIRARRRSRRMTRKRMKRQVKHRQS